MFVRVRFKCVFGVLVILVIGLVGLVVVLLNRFNCCILVMLILFWFDDEEIIGVWFIVGVVDS